MAVTQRDWERRIGGRLKLRDLQCFPRWLSGAAWRRRPHTSACLSRRCRKQSLILKPRFACVCWIATRVELNRRSMLPHCSNASALFSLMSCNRASRKIRISLEPRSWRSAAWDVRNSSSGFDTQSHRPPVAAVSQNLRRVSLIDTATVEFRELRDRNVDLLLARVPETLVDDDINIEVFFDDPHFVAAGASNPWVRRRNVNLAELVNEAWVFPKAK